MADLSAQLYGSPASQGAPPSKLFPDNANIDMYNQLPDHVKPMINALVEGRMPSSGRNSVDKSTMTQLIGLAQNIDPTFDQTVFNARNKTGMDFAAGGLSGKKLTSINTAMEHLANLEKNYGALNNTRFGWANSVINPVENALGDTSNQEHFASATRNASDLSGELANAFRTAGGMSESDISRELSGLDVNNAPSVMKGQITSAVQDLHGKFQPMVDSYNRTMGTNKTVSDFLSPTAKATYDRMMNGGFGSSSSAGQSSTASPVGKQIVSTGMYGGKKVVKYSDGSINYAN